MTDSAENKNHTKKQDIMKNLKEYNSSKNMSTPTELLVEFLSSIMVKDYEIALKYCIEILRHEPNNTTALEFYPLIVEKLEMIKNEELDSTSSETSSSSSMSSTSSENMLFPNEPLNRSEWGGNYSNYKKVMSNEEVNDTIKSNPIVSKRESANEYSTPVENNISLVPKSKSNFVSHPKQEIKMTVTRNITPLPSNLLIHPTQTITLISKNSSNVPTGTPPSSKKEKQTSIATKEKPSKLLLRTTPTITFPKRLPPQNLARTEDPQ